MAEIIPFKALRYNVDIVGDVSDVVTPPYDIISSEEQEGFYNVNPYNSIRLELPKDLPGDSEHDNKYTRAGEILNSWQDQGVLLTEEKDCLYIYQQEFKLGDQISRVRTGLIGLIRLEEFDKGIILPHENTLSKPKADRLQLMRACNANFSQVFGLYDDHKRRVPSLIDAYCSKHKPDILADGGPIETKERVWAVDDPQFIGDIREALKGEKLYIADGHHRYETALAYRNELRDKNPNHTGDELYNYVMMTMVDMEDSGLVILPTHRIVNGICNFSIDSLIDSLGDQFYIEEYDGAAFDIKEKSNIIQNILDEKGLHTFVLYVGSGHPIYALSLKSMDMMKTLHPKRHSSYLDLDVSILHSLILDRILGIGEKELANQENLEYTHNIMEGIEEVEHGNHQMTFFISSTAVRQIQEVSLANEKMPQKSTYFYPKLITGLVFNKFR
ncbi:MAG TPA: DUF1015 domain-containing protein [Clostridia bacterium]|nr:DUF1015 domain-containing protein [Clostridia bacterium]